MYKVLPNVKPSDSNTNILLNIKETRTIFHEKTDASPFKKKTTTQNCIKLCYKGNNLKNEHVRVMVLVHETWSECVLQCTNFVEIPLTVIKLQCGLKIALKMTIGK